MYNYNTNYGMENINPSLLNDKMSATSIWFLIALILAIVGAFVVYFIFVRPEKKYDNKFVSYLKRFLNFQEMLIEPILKIAYIFIALYITLISFGYISYSFLYFLFILILGNLCARIVYEFGMVLISIWQNTRDINKKMK